jgi:DNA-directed RNA polymerase specialized sigma24 family protein
MKNKASKNYVSNKNLIEEIKIFKETERMTEELGRMIISIATNYANKGSFIGYTWKADMISEAVLTCVKYLKNFDPTKYANPNPFAYITTIVHHAFISFIKKQNKHSAIKDVLYKAKQCFSDEYDNTIVTKGVDYSIFTIVKEEDIIKK